MRAKQGGHAVQRKYQIEGRHRTKFATRVRVLKQVQAKRAKAEADFRKKYGLPVPARMAYLPLD
jgi:hypothetical protein